MCESESISFKVKFISLLPLPLETQQSICVKLSNPRVQVENLQWKLFMSSRGKSVVNDSREDSSTTGSSGVNNEFGIDAQCSLIFPRKID